MMCGRCWFTDLEPLKPWGKPPTVSKPVIRVVTKQPSPVFARSAATKQSSGLIFASNPGKSCGWSGAMRPWSFPSGTARAGSLPARTCSLAGKPSATVAEARPKIMRNPRIYWDEKPLAESPKPRVHWVLDSHLNPTSSLRPLDCFASLAKTACACFRHNSDSDKGF